MISASKEEFSLKQANFSLGYEEYKCVTYVSIENGMISYTHTHTQVRAHTSCLLVPRTCLLPHPGTAMTCFVSASFLALVPEGADGWWCQVWLQLRGITECSHAPAVTVQLGLKGGFWAALPGWRKETGTLALHGKAVCVPAAESSQLFTHTAVPQQLCWGHSDLIAKLSVSTGSLFNRFKGHRGHRGCLGVWHTEGNVHPLVPKTRVFSGAEPC